jgi:thiol-disulfide isomerase/thioredoxin
VHIDAIYHTAIVFNNVEYFFGQGIHRKIPGSTHHGRPMSVVKLGRTDLPIDVVDEYVESLEAIYTAESYDLFLHNCNNFTQDLAMFLVGKSIPDEIRSLPQTFLNTPIGQMLRGQIDQSMRKMTQAPDAAAGQDVSAASNRPPPPPTATKPRTNGTSAPSIPNGTRPLKTMSTAIINAHQQQSSEVAGHVYNLTSLAELDRLLEAAKDSCAVIFFTSATCPPCKIVYPTYDELAAEAGAAAKLIKVDISASPSAHAVAQRYQVRATPTFITFLKGQKQDEWAGANPAQLAGNARLLLQMARPPQHQHAQLRLPTFQRVVENPIMYTRTPPLDKLLAKIPVPQFSQHRSVHDLVQYIKARDSKGMTEAPLPDLHSLSDHLASTFATLPPETHFAVIDLVRVAAVDPRVSSFLAADKNILSILLASRDMTSAPYNVQAVSLQLACNLFGSNVFQEQIFHGQNQTTTPTLKETIETLASQCLLSPHANARSMAAALVYNLAAFTHNQRMHGSTDNAGAGEAAAPSDDLSAALLESITTLSSLEAVKEPLHALLLALGMLLYGAPPDNMLWDLCQAMDLRDVWKGMKSRPQLKDEPLLKEIGDELLGKGSF